jgi:hypothetical protein
MNVGRPGATERLAFPWEIPYLNYASFHGPR